MLDRAVNSFMSAPVEAYRERRPGQRVETICVNRRDGLRHDPVTAPTAARASRARRVAPSRAVSPTAPRLTPTITRGRIVSGVDLSAGRAVGHTDRTGTDARTCESRRRGRRNSEVRDAAV